MKNILNIGTITPAPVAAYPAVAGGIVPAVGYDTDCKGLTMLTISSWKERVIKRESARREAQLGN